MTGKLIGALMIVAGCGGFGWSMAAARRSEELTLRQLIAALDFMQCELQYRLTPLPDLCHLAGREQNGIIGLFFRNLSLELESQISPDVSSCVAAALSRMHKIPGTVKEAIELLASSLGRFDSQGQLHGLEQVRQFCREEVDRFAQNREVRLRGYQTLGLCAGAALAILLV